MKLRSIIMVLFAAAAVLATAPVLADVSIYVGYAENVSSPVFFPNPWQNSPGTTFFGRKGQNWDCGAVLVRNSGPANATIKPGAYVDGFANGASFKLWDTYLGSGLVLPPGRSVIFTQTAQGNFKTDDQPAVSNVAQANSAQPAIHMTIDGTLYTFPDTSQVLNTGGMDTRAALRRNKSLQWRLIGTTGYEDPAGQNIVPTDVLTQRNDIARSGVNATELTLRPLNVQSATFGMRFSHAVDGYVYAEPLVVSNLTLANGDVHNVVLVATEHNSVYAFDGDSATGATAQPLWQVNLGPSVPASVIGCNDLVPEVGITGTPVVSRSLHAVYVVAKTYENSSMIQRLHKLDIKSGAEMPGSPVTLSASVVGTGDGATSDGHVTFDPATANQRPALLLSGNSVYVASASHCDGGPYHGWVLSYNAATLQRGPVFNSTPNGYDGGIWQSGGGLAADAAGKIFCVTGNGTFDADARGRDYGNTFLRLDPASSLAPADYFTPHDQAALSAADADVGSGGPLLLPASAGSAAHPHLLVAASKGGTIYLIDRDHMGGYNASDDSQIVQNIPDALGGTWSAPTYFNGTLYYQASGDLLKAFALSNGQINPAPTSQSTGYAQFPGTTPVVSANGASDGVVWTLENGASGLAILHAFDPSNVANELYNSASDLGPYVKFTNPVIANGKVYVATQNSINVLGGGYFTSAPTITPNGGSFTGSVKVTLASATYGAQIRYTTDGSAPTATSHLYTGPFVLARCIQIRARAFAPGSFPGSETAASFMVESAAGTGTGLQGIYFKTINLSGNSIGRVDPTIDFHWNGASPISGVQGTGWSARWTGKVQPQCTGTYTFYTQSDDGVRLWVNGVLVIDDWTDHTSTQDSGTIDLTAGQKYDIKVEYYQNTGDSLLQLSWSAMEVPAAVIPMTQLYPR